MLPEPETLQRLQARIDRFPRVTRSMAYGAFILWLVIAFRGGPVLIPLLLLLLLITSDTALTDIVFIAAAFAMATIGGALAGLAYEVLGRPLRRIPAIGPYVAGVVTVIPYAAAVVLIVRAKRGDPILAPPDFPAVLSVGIAALLFGPLLGYFLFQEDAA